MVFWGDMRWWVDLNIIFSIESSSSIESWTLHGPDFTNTSDLNCKSIVVDCDVEVKCDVTIQNTMVILTICLVMNFIAL